MMPAMRARREHVAFRDVAGLDARQGLGLHDDAARRRPRRGRSRPCPRHRPCAGRGRRIGVRSGRGRDSSRRVAAATSPARISDSPTRKQRAPAAASGRDRPGRRCRSRRPRGGPAGTSGASSSVVSRSTFKVLRLRLLMPIRRVSSRSARSSSVAIMDLDQHVHAELARRRRRDPRHASSSAAMISRMQSAPIARLSSDLIGVEDEVLAQHRQTRRRRARRRGSRRCPGNTARRSGPRGRSRRPPRRPAPARADRSRRGSGPRLGLAFLISAISP